jgi:hypothetical protein
MLSLKGFPPGQEVNDNEENSSPISKHDRCPLISDVLLHCSLRIKVLDLGIENTTMDL